MFITPFIISRLLSYRDNSTLIIDIPHYRPSLLSSTSPTFQHCFHTFPHTLLPHILMIAPFSLITLSCHTEPPYTCTFLHVTPSPSLHAVIAGVHQRLLKHLTMHSRLRKCVCECAYVCGVSVWCACMCMCMCVLCACVCVCVCVVCACACVWCVPVCVCMYVCVHVCVWCVHVHVHVCVWCVCVCMCVCVCVCDVHVPVCVWCVCVCMCVCGVCMCMCVCGACACACVHVCACACNAGQKAYENIVVC